MKTWPPVNTYFCLCFEIRTPQKSEFTYNLQSFPRCISCLFHKIRIQIYRLIYKVNLIFKNRHFDFQNASSQDKWLASTEKTHPRCRLSFRQSWVNAADAQCFCQLPTKLGPDGQLCDQPAWCQLNGVSKVSARAHAFELLNYSAWPANQKASKLVKYWGVL